MKWLRFWSRLYLLHLEDEITYLRDQVVHERQRAERAIDELLSLRVNVPPVTLPTPREVQQAETAVERLLRDSEFVSVGETDDR